MSYLRHIETCTRFDPSNFLPFLIEGEQFGYVTKDAAALLAARTPHLITDGQSLSLDPSLDNFELRSALLGEAAAILSKEYQVDLRDEFYPVIQNWGDEPLAEIDRSAVPWFGTRGFGIHVNGFVRQPDGIHLWIAERAMDRLIDPGKLDNIIAGGQPIGLTLTENLAKESWEEAGIPAPLAKTAKAIDTISYKVERMRGLRNDTLFCYDLELPENIIPRNTDGEVGSFQLLSAAEVAEILRTTDRFKFNCALVVLDFLARHRLLDESDTEYKALKEALTKLK